MAFHWRCYKFICHNLLYAPLLAYLYMPSRGHTHRSSLSLSLSPSDRESRPSYGCRGEREEEEEEEDDGKGRGAEQQPAYKTPNAAPSSFLLPPSLDFSNATHPSFLLPRKQRIPTTTILLLLRSHIVICYRIVEGKIRSGNNDRVKVGLCADRKEECERPCSNVMDVISRCRL